MTTMYPYGEHRQSIQRDQPCVHWYSLAVRALAIGSKYECARNVILCNGICCDDWLSGHCATLLLSSLPQKSLGPLNCSFRSIVLILSPVSVKSSWRDTLHEFALQTVAMTATEIKHNKPDMNYMGYITCTIRWTIAKESFQHHDAVSPL